jgi:1-acyl-sn-glycerol-3-phosphate acyltransferase
MRVLRRAITFPAWVLAALAWTALLPGLLPLALLADAFRRKRLATARLVLGVFLYLAFELLGIAVVGGLALVGAAARERVYRLEGLWADLLLRAVLGLYGARLDVRGLDLLRPGPILLVGNHVSVADALLPVAFATARRGLRLRGVAKAELVWDPCVDLAGHLLPHVFVRRGATDTAGDLARVLALAEGLGPDDGIALLPEGTRYTPERHAAALARREAEGAGERLERDRALRSLMPPRTGGLLALLDRCAGADLIVMAHAGLEGIVRIPDLWAGSLVGRTLRVEFWRVPRASLPAGREARIDWIYDQWERLDRWVTEARAAPPSPPPAPLC